MTIQLLLLMALHRRKKISRMTIYARGFDKENEIRQLPTGVPEGHYEVALSGSDDPYWEPASVEDALRNQLQEFAIGPHGLV